MTDDTSANAMQQHMQKVVAKGTSTILELFSLILSAVLSIQLHNKTTLYTSIKSVIEDTWLLLVKFVFFEKKETCFYSE